MKYYFYVLNEVRLPENKYLVEAIDAERELLGKISEKKNKKLKGLYLYGISLSHKLRSYDQKRSEEFEFQNGQDARYFTRYGVKEVDEEGYNRIVEDDLRIVGSFSEKTLKLMDNFKHSKDGWHFPFFVEAESKSHLRWKLNEMYPNYEVHLK